MPSKSKTRKPVVPYGMSNKQMKRKKPINTDLMRNITPLTPNQEELFRCYENNQNVVAYGCAGTGKTFITLYNALRDVLDPKTPYEKIYIVRSLVSTREIGFLQEIMKISHHSIRFLTNIWSNICLRCQQRQILKCFMVI